MWLLSVDNDSYSFEDGNYSNGLALTWLSPEIEHTAPNSLARRVAAAASWLPGLDADAERYVGLSVGQLIFTPESLLAPNPPLDERPYAGVLFFDTSLMTRDERTLSSWFLRLGVAGEPSMAEEFQKELHEWFGADRPRGWSHQVRDEFLVNVGFERRDRTSERSLGGGLVFDVTPNVGGAAGNYITGLNAGVRVRIGKELPRDMGSQAMRTFGRHPAIVDAPDRRTQSFFFVGADGSAIAHFLPIDGNVLADGRGIDSKNFVASGTAGFTLIGGSFRLTVSYTLLSDSYETQERAGQFGTISVAWFR